MNSPLQHFGEPITCYHGDNKPQDIINQYCWLQGTYKLDQKYQEDIGCWGKNKTKDFEKVIQTYMAGFCLRLCEYLSLGFLVIKPMFSSYKSGRVVHTI